MEFKDIEGKEIIGFQYKDGYPRLPWGSQFNNLIGKKGIVLEEHYEVKHYIRVGFDINGRTEKKYYPLGELIEYFEANETPIDLDNLFKDIKNMRT